MEGHELRDIIETQKKILKELSNLKYGSKKATFAEKLSDKIVGFLGSWKFLIMQSFILLAWIAINIFSFAFDQYPFILLNLVLSFQAAFATPLILMASNRSEKKDRRRADDAYRAIAHIEKMMERMVDPCKKLYNEVNGTKNDGKSTK
jgi:uncharacterized membrane protein